MALALLAACGPTAEDDTPAPGTDASPPPAPVIPDVDHESDYSQAGVVEVDVAPPEGARLAEHINIGLDPITILNNNLPGALSGTQVNRLVHDRLIEKWGPEDYRPGLATEWYSLDGFNTITMHLRQGVTWHNGEPFTSDCVAFTFEIAAANQTGTAWTRLRDVAEVVIVDRYTVELVMHAADRDFEFNLSHWAATVQNRRSYEDMPDNPNWALVGTGPFRITHFSPSDVVHLERFDDYWGGLVPTQRISFWSIPEFSTRNVMLQTGELQKVQMLTPADRDAMVLNPDFTVTEMLNSTADSIFFNNGANAPAFIQCHYFRLAVAHALNRDDIATVVGGNWARAWPDRGPLWGARTEFWMEDVEPRLHNTTLAREYLERSVWDGETFIIATGPGNNAIMAELIQLQLQAVGINVEIDLMEATTVSNQWTYDQERDNHAAMLFLGGAGFTAIGGFRAALLPNVSTNRLNINSPFIVEKFETVGSTTATNEERREATHEVLRYTWDLVAGIPLIRQVFGITTVNGIGGIQLYYGDQSRGNFRWIYWDLNQTAPHLQP
jgi:peptide/nickel transport system substrate-binding protein